MYQLNKLLFQTIVDLLGIMITKLISQKNIYAWCKIKEKITQHKLRKGIFDESDKSHRTAFA